MSKEAVCDFLRRCVVYADASINLETREEDATKFNAGRLTEISRHTRSLQKLKEANSMTGSKPMEKKIQQPSFFGEAMGDDVENIDTNYLEHPERAGMVVDSDSTKTGDVAINGWREWSSEFVSGFQCRIAVKHPTIDRCIPKPRPSWSTA